MTIMSSFTNPNIVLNPCSEHKWKYLEWNPLIVKKLQIKITSNSTNPYYIQTHITYKSILHTNPYIFWIDSFTLYDELV